MAFFRFSRDKRGYEHFYLVEPVANRRGKSQPRVLYFFRTPPNVKIGREPFDDEVRHALEAHNPHVAFDWRKILETPIPSADADKWRERRRVERAARQGSRGVQPAEEDRSAEDESSAEPGESAANGHALPTVVESAAATAEAPSRVDHAARKRRRRRRGRGSQQPGPSQSSPSAPADGHAAASPHPPEEGSPQPPKEEEEERLAQGQDEVGDEPSGE